VQERKAVQAATVEEVAAIGRGFSMDDLVRIFEKLGGIEASQKAFVKSHEDLRRSIDNVRDEVREINKKLTGSNGTPGLCTRVTELETWKKTMVVKCYEHMVRSGRRTWALVGAVVVGIVTKLLWSWYSD